MKYMCLWSVTPENMQAATKLFKEGSEPIDGITQLGRWWYLGPGGGFRLIETDDPGAIKKMTRYWQDVMEVEIVPVIDDEENRRSMRG